MKIPSQFWKWKFSLNRCCSRRGNQIFNGYPHKWCHVSHIILLMLVHYTWAIRTTVGFHSRVYEVTNDFSGTGSQTCWSDRNFFAGIKRDQLLAVHHKFQKIPYTLDTLLLPALRFSHPQKLSNFRQLTIRQPSFYCLFDVPVSAACIDSQFNSVDYLIGRVEGSGTFTPVTTALQRLVYYHQQTSL